MLELSSMKWLYNWLKPKTRREILAFIGAAIAAVAAATWGVATHEWTGKRFFKATYTVCQADYKEFCPSQSEYLPCDANWQEWAAKECGNFVAEFEPERHYESCQRGGYCPRCYPLVVQVTCRANK